MNGAFSSSSTGSPMISSGTTGKRSSKLAGDKIPSGYKAASLQQFTPEQMELLNQRISELGPDSFLARLVGGDQSIFDELEAPAFRQFNEQLGGLASRFSGMGLGGRRSSGFQNTSNAAASNFAQDLQSQRLGIRTNALQSLQQMSNQLLGQRPVERALVEKPKPWWQTAATGFASGVGQGIGSSAFSGGG